MTPATSRLSLHWSAFLFAAANLVPTSAGQAPAFPLSPPVAGLHPGLAGGQAAVADFNNDGRDDIASAISGYVSFILTVPGGGYGPYSIPVALQNAESTVQFCRDVTSDGNADLLVSFHSYASGTTSTFLYVGSGGGQLVAQIPIPDASGLVAANHVCFSADALASSGTSALVLCTRSFFPNVIAVSVVQVAGQAAATVAGPVIVSQPPGVGSFGLTSAGDVDGDGFLDLVGFGYPTGFGGPRHIVILPGIPSPPWFGSTLLVVAIPANATYYAGVADVNNDGLADAIGRAYTTPMPWSTPTADIAVFLGDPTTPFTTVVASQTGLELTGRAAIEDFDADGVLDYVSLTQPPPMGTGAPGLAFFRGDGTGSFRPPMTLAPSSAFTELVAADENGDGARDLVCYVGFPTVLYNESRLGPGGPGAGGVVPQTTAGIAIPGNQSFHLGITGAPANSPAILGVSLGVLPAAQASGLVIDPGSLLLPTSTLGTFMTDAMGSANWSLGLPPSPPLPVGTTVYLQWGVFDPGALTGTGYALTPGRKIVCW